MNHETIQIKKDICYMYHVQSEYEGFMPDLDYTNELPLKYWKYVNDEDSFIQIGCLLITLLMALDIIDGSGDCLRKNIEECKHAVAAVIPVSVDLVNLKESVLTALTAASSNSQLTESQEKNINSIYGIFVRGYFKHAIE